MNILLTGATGFLGTHIRKIFEKENQKEDLILVSRDKIPGFRCILHNDYKIQKQQFMELGIDEIDTLIHLGGKVPLSSGREHWQEGEKYLSNIESTYNLLAELPAVPHNIIFASSVMVYEDSQDIISEHTKTAPFHQYGMSKLFCEWILERWTEEHNVDLQILRIGQCYGAGENTKLLIPSFIDRAIHDETIAIYSDGSEKRTFIHAEDVARCIYKAIFLEGSHIVNVVGKKSYSVKEIAEFISAIEGKQHLVHVENQKFKTRNFIFDNSLMERYLDHEQVKFMDGICEEYQFRKELFVKEDEK